MGWIVMLAAALTLGSAAPDEDEMAKAIAAYEAGDARGAESVMRAQAEAGLAEAQFLLGRMLARGELGEPDFVQAARWFRAAAGQGEARAKKNLAAMLWDGMGVETDRAEAERLFHAAAEQGQAQAHHNLALRYQSGEISTGEDMEAARRYFRAAGEAGIAAAEREYARMLIVGQGGERDRQAAYPILLRLAGDGDVESMIFLSALYGIGLDGAPDREQERIWMTRAWEAGRDARAAYSLGVNARSGEGMDPDASAQWFFRAVQSGAPADSADQARSALLSVFRGRWREPDVWDPEIIAWLEAEAERERDAQIALARAYGAGRGVGHDEARGRAMLIEMAQADGDTRAMYQLGALCAEQQSVEDWRERSWMWFELARRNDHSESVFSRSVSLALRRAESRLESGAQRARARELAEACARSQFTRCE